MKVARSMGGVFLAMAALVMGAAPAAASCAMPAGSAADRVAAAEFAFVGTVTDVTNDGRNAQVDVEESWRGDVEQSATVRGSEGGPGTATSVDRTYEQGRRYLFMPYAYEAGAYRDNNCSGTQQWRGKLDKLRPADAVVFAAPRGGDAEPAAPQSSPQAAAAPWWLWALAAAALILASAAFAAVRMRSSSTPAQP